ncbi:MAG: hypothetical protein INR68_12630 [Methylobacterium mesophilicum]|nr:hypothetical protein [Methylobacterium mesophilicum]
MFDHFSRLAAQWRAGRARRRTQFILSRLSPEMQRDIGYRTTELIPTLHGSL